MTESGYNPPERSRLKAYWSKCWRIGVGTILILFGAFLGLIPGVPGIFFAIAGLALMAEEVPIAKRAMVKLKAKTEAAAKRFRKTKG